MRQNENCITSYGEILLISYMVLLSCLLIGTYSEITKVLLVYKNKIRNSLLGFFVVLLSLCGASADTRIIV